MLEPGSMLSRMELWDCFGNAPLSLAVTKLCSRLGQNSSPKQFHGAIQHKPDPVPRTKLE